MFHTLLHSRQWNYRLIRLSFLLLIVGWLFKDVVYAQLPMSLQWPKTDFDKTSVDLKEIQSGGPPKDGIPAVDNPKFVTSAEAAKWIAPKEPVISLEIGGQARAYPLQILMFHEIANDELGGIPISVTFCPLCNASIVFDRRVNGQVLDFGTTGNLRKSDMVMYDRQTESWWQQFTGKAIIGELVGTQLKRLTGNIVAFEDFVKAYPNGDVLSRETGHSRPYGQNPYRGYDSIQDRPFLFFDPLDPRLPVMERVLNISIGGENTLYPFSLFASKPVVNDSVGGTPVVVFSQQGTLSVLDKSNISESRQVPSATAFNRRLGNELMSFIAKDGKIIDTKTQSHWNLLGQAVEGPLQGKKLTPAESGVHFAFAWLAFNPDSKIYEAPK